MTKVFRRVFAAAVSIDSLGLMRSQLVTSFKSCLTPFAPAPPSHAANNCVR